MCTDRALRGALAAALLLGWTATAWAREPADAARAWFDRDDPVLVVLVLDGLRDDLVDATDPQGTPLMPNLARLRASSLVFDDCLSSSPDPVAGLYALITGESPLQVLSPPRPASTGLSARARRGVELWGWCASLEPWSDPGLRTRLPWLLRGGQPRGTYQDKDSGWVGLQGAAFDSVTALAVDAERPGVVVLIADFLRPPFLVSDDVLRRTDPAPWQGGSSAMSIERLVEARLRRGQMWASNDPHREWVQRAAHATADSLLTPLLARVEAGGSRLSILVAATHVASPSPPAATANPLAPKVTHVPLWWRLPEAGAAHLDHPVTTRDVGATLGWLIGGDGQPRLFRAEPGRERWSLGWGQTMVRRALAGYGAVKVTDGRLSVAVVPPHPPRVFDLQYDPKELQDLSGSEPDLVARQAQKVATHLLGETYTIQVAVTASGPRVLTATLTPPQPQTEVTRRELEEGDELVSLGGETIWMEFLMDNDVDAFQLEQNSTPGPGRLDLQPDDGADWPVYLGPNATPQWSSPLEWSLGSREFFEMLAVSPVDQTEWAAGRPDGIYIWLIPSGGERPGP